MTSAAERENFDAIFERVHDRLPDEVLDLLEEVPIVIEDEPTRDILASLGLEARPGDSDLCGLHSGVSLREQSVLETNLAPTQIYLFRGPLLRLVAWDLKKLEKEIHITLLHEIGHLFGMTEEDLEALGYD